MWLRVLEAYMVQALLRTPAFHRVVEKVAKNVHRIRHGLPPDAPSGTSIDRPGQSDFGKHFLDEIKTQIGFAEQKEASNAIKDSSVNARRQRSNVVEEENSDAAWKNIQGSGKARGQKSSVVEEETSDGAWQNAQKNGEAPAKATGFMEEYMDALREQVRNQKNGR